MTFTPEEIQRAKATPIQSVIGGLKLRRRGGSPERPAEFVGACVRCGGGTDRFSVSVAKQIFRCRRCDRAGDVIALTMFLDDCSFAEAVETLLRKPAFSRGPGNRGEIQKPASSTDTWRRIWRETVDPTGTIAEVYLASRGLSLPEGIADVRYHGALWHDGARRPGIVALFRDIVTNDPCGIHRTYFDSEGRKIDRRMLGRAAGAAIKISPDEDVELGLHVAEGVETAIAGWLAGYRPVWATGSAGGIAAFPPLSGVESITVLGERDDGGANERATAKLASTWLAHDPRAEIYAIEMLTGEDMNDAWRDATNARR